MKFSLFHQVERYDDSISHRQLQEELTELTLMAERGGFDKVWVGEHHAMEFTVSPSAFVSLAYLAGQTSTIRLGTGTAIAPFFHPIRMAGEIGQLDVMSNGRLDVGIARGAYMFEYERQLPNFSSFTGDKKAADVAMDAGLRMRELIPAVQQLLIGNYAHEGTYWQFPSTTAVPRPIQKPFPPMWVAARDPNTHSFAVAHGCNIQVTPLHLGESEVAGLMDKFNAACAENPTMPRPEVMLLMHTYVAETEDEIVRGSRDMEEFFHYFAKWFRNTAPIVDGFIEPVTQEDRALNPAYAASELRKNMVVGTPDEVIAKIKGYEALGYDEFSIWLDSHMDFEQKSKSLSLFIDKVVPAFNN
ncbi:MAG: LLM class flavin-dependent oxidoreductase [Actinomycetes bacterium]